MAERTRFRPFTGDSERKIAIHNPPLELVLVQIRWPEHGRFMRDFRTLALDFGDQLNDFPLFNEVTETGVQITPEGVTSIPGETAYQWRSTDDVWGIHLTKRFISLFCVRHEAYEFAELQKHLGVVTELLSSQLQVRTIERTGIRYVNRIADEQLIPRLGDVFIPAVLGYNQLDGFAGDIELHSSFNQAVYQAEEVTLHVRSGLLAPGETPDPAIPQVTGKTWVLDLDAFVEQRLPYDPSATGEYVSRLADVVYDFFKLVLKEGTEDQLDGAS